MKIVCIADLHIGSSRCGKTDSATGLHTRELDFLNSIDQAIDFALDEKNKVDLFAILGDIFENTKPSMTQLREYAKRVHRLSVSGLETIILKGNHDTYVAEGLGHTSSVIKELDIPHITIVDEPELHVFKDVAIVAMPYMHQGRNGLKTVEEVEAYYKETVGMLRSQSGKKLNVCLAHQTVDKAVMSAGYRDLTSFDEAVIPLDVFKDFDATILGHIHKHQGVQKSPPVVYCGSIDRKDFGEAKEEKGFVLYDTNVKKVNFIKIDVRGFEDIKVDLSNNSKDITERIIKYLRTLSLKDKVVKLTIMVREEDIVKLNIAEIKKEFKETFYAKDVHYDIIKEKRSRNENINEALKPIDAFKEYVQRKPEYKDFEKRLLEEGEKLVIEVNSGPVKTKA